MPIVDRHLVIERPLGRGDVGGGSWFPQLGWGVVGSVSEAQRELVAWKVVRPLGIA